MRQKWKWLAGLLTIIFVIAGSFSVSAKATIRDEWNMNINPTSVTTVEVMLTQAVKEAAPSNFVVKAKKGGKDIVVTDALLYGTKVVLTLNGAKMGADYTLNVSGLSTEAGEALGALTGDFKAPMIEDRYSAELVTSAANFELPAKNGSNATVTFQIRNQSGVKAPAELVDGMEVEFYTNGYGAVSQALITMENGKATTTYRAPALASDATAVITAMVIGGTPVDALKGLRASLKLYLKAGQDNAPMINDQYSAELVTSAANFELPAKNGSNATVTFQIRNQSGVKAPAELVDGMEVEFYTNGYGAVSQALVTMENGKATTTYRAPALASDATAVITAMVVDRTSIEAFRGLRASLKLYLKAGQDNVNTDVTYDGDTYEVTKPDETAAFKAADVSKSVVIIPDTIEVDGITYQVTAIADGACKDSQTITKVIIGKNVAVIGRGAFSGCTNLSEIIIESEALSEAGENAFERIHPNAAIRVPSSKLSAYRKLLKDKGQGQNVKIVKDAGKAASLTVSAGKKVADRHGVFLDQAVSVQTSGDYCRIEVDDADWLGVSAEQTDDISLGLSKLPSHTGGTFYLLAAENEDETRTAAITVSDASGKTKKTIRVTQVGSETSYLEVETTANKFGETAAFGKAVNVLADEDTNWTAAASKKWIKVAESNDTQAKKYASKEISGTGSFYIYVKANGTYASRSGYVTVSAPNLGTFQIKVTQEANKRRQKALLAELKVGVSKKTFSRSKTSQVKFTYPKGLSKKDVKKVTYSSSKKKVASVNSKGAVKGIRKGKAKILVKVTLKSGVSKTFTLRITVGKRNVRLVKK